MSFEVDNNGNVSARSYRYSAPREGKYTVTVGDWIPPEGTVITAPVHLPQGAVLTSMKVYYTDSISDADGRYELFFRSLIYRADNSMAAVETSGTPDASSVITTSFVEPTIDNDARGYFVRGTILNYKRAGSASMATSEPVAAPASTIYVHGIVLTYTTAEVE